MKPMGQKLSDGNFENSPRKHTEENETPRKVQEGNQKKVEFDLQAPQEKKVKNLKSEDVSKMSATLLQNYLLSLSLMKNIA